MTCQGISLGLVSIGCCCFPFCHSKGGFYLFFTRSVAEVTDFLCPDFFPCPEFANLRIFFLHTENRGGHGVSLSRIFEFSIFFFSHGESRRSRIFFVPRLVLGPTDRREVIFEFLSSVTFRDIPCDKKKIR